MTPSPKFIPGAVCGLLVCLLLGAMGCGKTKEEAGVPTAEPLKPQEAATELQQAFVSAPPEVQQSAQAASEAMRVANYEQAIKSLQAMRMRQNLTPEQGMAVYNSSRALEANLIAAMEAGDPKAKQAYEMLRKTRRN